MSSVFEEMVKALRKVQGGERVGPLDAGERAPWTSVRAGGGVLDVREGGGTSPLDVGAVREQRVVRLGVSVAQQLCVRWRAPLSRSRSRSPSPRLPLLQVPCLIFDHLMFQDRRTEGEGRLRFTGFGTEVYPKP